MKFIVRFIKIKNEIQLYFFPKGTLEGAKGAKLKSCWNEA